MYLSKCGFDEVLDLTVRDIGLVSYLFSWRERCQWTVKVPKGNTIKVVIEYYSLVGECAPPRCDIDVLEVYDKSDSGDDKLAAVCGDTTNPQEIVYGTGNLITVALTNDDMYLQNVFQLVFLPTDVLHCPSYIGLEKKGHTYSINQTGPVVFIDRSVKFPCAGLMCESSCHLSTTSDACFQCPECPTTNMGRAVIDSVLQKGQTVSVEDMKGAITLPIQPILKNYCEDGDCSGCGSPRTLSSTTGSIYSTNYLTGDLYYYPDTFCKWTILAPSAQYIHVRFDSFDVPSSHSGVGQRHCASYVALYNGSDVNDIDLMDIFCGSHIPLLSSLSNELTIVFSSDQTTSGTGFTASYQTRDCQGYGMDMSECKRHIYANSKCGYFKSSGYPHPYQSNAICSWSIEVAEGDVILLEFIDFNVGDRSCEHDFVKVYASRTADDAYLLRTLCGDEMPSPVISPSSILYMEFKGEQMSEDSTGFLARYTAIPYQLEIPQAKPTDLCKFNSNNFSSCVSFPWITGLEIRLSLPMNILEFFLLLFCASKILGHRVGNHTIDFRTCRTIIQCLFT
ncbi:cubilin-like [Ptychodera flava]|uniref:cubilin-like n=1 Tax=Ptychodera flava TaxID=63121 RepID=UPI00396A0D0A